MKLYDILRKCMKLCVKGIVLLYVLRFLLARVKSIVKFMFYY